MTPEEFQSRIGALWKILDQFVALHEKQRLGKVETSDAITWQKLSTEFEILMSEFVRQSAELGLDKERITKSLQTIAECYDALSPFSDRLK